MTNKHVKKLSTSLAIRDTQSKTTMRHYFTPARMAVIRRTQIVTNVG